VCVCVCVCVCACVSTPPQLTPPYTALMLRLRSGFKRGVAACTSRINKNDGLFHVTNDADWARSGQGGANVAANALLYHTLVCGAALAEISRDASAATEYSTAAAAIKTALNSELWDSSVGAFKDNPTSSLHPQDGNSLMCWFNATTPERCTR
jgi:hypothetical protein